MSEEGEGTRLVSCFKRLGCPIATFITGSSFDYLFEDPNLSSFLRSFCKKVESGELVTLSDEEIETFRNLESAGRMLDGDLLDKALRAFQWEGAVIGEDLRESGTLLEDVSHLQSYQKELLSSYKHLSAQKTKSDTLTALLQKRLPTLKRDLIQQQHTCEKDRRNVVENLKELAEALEKIFEIHEGNRARNEKDSTDFRFLSRLDLNGYLGSEEKFLLEMKKYIRMTFIKREVMSFALEKEDGDLQPNGIAVWRRDYLQLKECLKESRQRNLLAEASSKGRKLQMKILRDKFSDRREVSCFELQKKLKELLKASETAKQEMSNLLKEAIPETTSSYANDRLEKIVTANYQLKLEKQKYLSERQHQVLELLMMQESRLSFVVAVLQQEAEQHWQLNKILDDVQQMVERDTQSLHTREDMLRKLKEEEKLGQHELSLDATSQALATILGNSDVSLSYRELAESAAAARKRYDKQLISFPQHLQERAQKLSRMEATLKEMEDLLSSSSPASAEMNQSLDVLKRKVQLMERMVAGMVEEVKSKKIVTSNPAEVLKRECFIQYLTNRDQFISTVKRIDSS